MPADNKRFGEIGGKVIARISLYPLTGSVSPNCVQLIPQLRQAAASLHASGRQRRREDIALKRVCSPTAKWTTEKLKVNNIIK